MFDNIADASSLTDAEWADINALKRAWEQDGQKGIRKALGKFEKADPVRYLRIMAAVDPVMVREAVKDAMAERGMTMEDLRELVQKLENSTRIQ